VIKSHKDLSASGIDGINYRIMKGARTEGIKFIKILSERVYKLEKQLRPGKSEENSITQKREPRPDQKFETNIKHKLYPPNLHLPDGSSNSEHQVQGAYLLE
jgi:hypothetical protein